MTGPELPSAPAGSAFAEFFDSMRKLGLEYAGSTAEGGRFQCPGHDDQHASLDVTVGTDRQAGKPVLNCKVCELEYGEDRSEWIEELRARGVRLNGKAAKARDLDWGPRADSIHGGGHGGGGHGEITRTGSMLHKYCHADGTINFVVQRHDVVYADGTRAKLIRPKRHGLEGFTTGLEGVERTPYRLESFGDWRGAGKPLYLVEGEKTADALIKHGKLATTFHGGANSPRPKGWARKWFGGFGEIRVWPDADGAGVAYARKLIKELKAAGISASAWGVPAELLDPKDDAFDVLAKKLGAHVRELGPADARALAALNPLPSRRKPPTDEKKVVSVDGGEGEVDLGDRPQPYNSAANVDPQSFVEEYLDRLYKLGGTLILRFSEEHYWLWEVNHYKVITKDEMSAIIARDLHGAEETLDGESRPIRLKSGTKAEILGALRDKTLISNNVIGDLKPATGGVPFLNGWLDVGSRDLGPITPDRFVRWNVPDRYDPDALEPGEWLRFLKTLGWTPDTPEYRLLRQWMGYVLSGMTEMQKALLLIGPPRSGKGTILKVCEAMIGEGAVGLDLGAFNTDFGLSPIIGKGLATIGDARFDLGNRDRSLVRRILTAVGEDRTTIDIKFKDPVSVSVTARIMIATNELPSVLEASSAFTSRFLFLKFTESYLDREDRGWFQRISAELPGVIKWALSGLDDLVEEGRFSETDSGKEMQHEMARMGNPIRDFVETECKFSQVFTSTEELHEAYVLWAERKKYYVPNEIKFARDLTAAFSENEIHRSQQRRGQKTVRGFIGLELL